MAKIVEKKLTEIIPYENNPRRNSEAVEFVANSIREFGFKNPIILDKNSVIIAGHTRYLAGLSLGLETAPCIVADDLTPEQVKAFRLADNKTAEIADWDEDLLSQELADLLDYDMTEFGFDPFDFEAEEEKENPYTTAVNIPQYEPQGLDVSLDDLVDVGKAEWLVSEIENSNVSEDEKQFLKKAATRHYAFNYKKVAEYYADASKEMQELMEKSALVIIDYDDAIRYGYVRLSQDIREMMESDES